MSASGISVPNLPHPVEAVVRAVDGEHRGPGVRLGHPAVPLEHNHLCPDLVVDLCPFVQHFLDVFLRAVERINRKKRVAYEKMMTVGRAN